MLKEPLVNVGNRWYL